MERYFANEKEKEMKKILIVIGIIALACIFSACNNTQTSDYLQVKKVMDNVPEFQKVIQYISIESGVSLDPFTSDPNIFESDPEIGTPKIIHEVFYERTDGNLGIAFLDDTPKIVLHFVWNSEDRQRLDAPKS